MSDANPLLEETMIFNGIDGASGGYLLPEMDAAQLSSLAQGQVLDPEMLKELKKRKFDIKNPQIRKDYLKKFANGKNFTSVSNEIFKKLNVTRL